MEVLAALPILVIELKLKIILELKKGLNTEVPDTETIFFKISISISKNLVDSNIDSISLTKKKVKELSFEDSHFHFRQFRPAKKKKKILL